ncbi:MAG: polysaccharide biosynthesis/export family protein [bacterium]
MRKQFYYISILALLFLSSCNTQKKIVYLQDIILDTELPTIENGEIRFKPHDIITINVSSRNEELASIFNLYGVSSSSSTNNSTSRTVGYTIDPEGNINFPVLGKLKAEGYTKLELANDIQKRIIESKLVDDPIVTVEYQNLKFSTIGDLGKVGSILITREKTTIFEALSESGDLAITGLRDKVFLTRRVGNSLITYKVDLRSKDIYQSPAFYIQQNDLIYVEPSKLKTNQSTANGNSLLTPSFWMTLTSFVTTMTLLFVNL